MGRFVADQFRSVVTQPVVTLLGHRRSAGPGADNVQAGLLQ